MPEHTDRYNRPLKVGQKCIYIASGKTSYSTHLVKIVAFTPKSAKIQGTFYSWENNPKCVSCSSLLILSEEGINWDAING